MNLATPCRSPRVLAAVALVLAAAACGNSPVTSMPDLSATADLTTPAAQPDLTPPPPDLTALPDLLTPAQPDLTPAPMNACLDTADATVLSKIDVQGIIGTCGQNNLGTEPATYNCIVQMTGLTPACAGCFDGIVDCTVQNCIAQCITSTTAPACTMCRATNCNPAFAACSGLTP